MHPSFVTAALLWTIYNQIFLVLMYSRTIEIFNNAQTNLYENKIMHNHDVNCLLQRHFVIIVKYKLCSISEL